MTIRSIHIGPEARVAIERIREITREIADLEERIRALRLERARQMDIWRGDSTVGLVLDSVPLHRGAHTSHRPLDQEPVDPEPAPVEPDAD